MAKSDPKISVKNVAKSFGKKHVLKDISFDVAEGESLVIIGGSGSGKSVTIKMILGLLEHDSGTIEIDGLDVLADKKDKGRSQIGMLFQGGALFDSLPVWQNISFKLLYGTQNLSPKKAKALAIKKLAAVGLGETVADQLPAELSGGMQKRVSLARAIADDPKILFFDEPTTGLDPITAATINDLIRSVTRDAGITAISITHDMASVKAIADKVAFLYEGEIIWCDSIKKLEKSGNDYVDQFINGRADGPIQVIKAS